jgi:hypothetical protein
VVAAQRGSRRMGLSQARKFAYASKRTVRSFPERTCDMLLESDGSPIYTSRPFCCPNCDRAVQMEVVWPIWLCPHCQSRLIPADDNVIVPSLMLMPAPAPAAFIDTPIHYAESLLPQ